MMRSLSRTARHTKSKPITPVHPRRRLRFRTRGTYAHGNGRQSDALRGSIIRPKSRPSVQPSIPSLSGVHLIPHPGYCGPQQVADIAGPVALPASTVPWPSGDDDSPSPSFSGQSVVPGAGAARTAGYCTYIRTSPTDNVAYLPAKVAYEWHRGVGTGPRTPSGFSWLSWFPRTQNLNSGPFLRESSRGERGS